MHLFGKRIGLSLEQKQHLKAWRVQPRQALNIPFESARYVVMDVETSGLNLRKDKLISIGAVAVVNGRIVLGECYYIVLQQEAVSERDNILLHEISGSVQRTGMPAADALLGFLEFVGKDPLVAFHVAFDKTMLRKSLRRYLGFSFKHPWLDLAYALPGLNPLVTHRLHTLDEWSKHFVINNEARHNALADALATAQLFLVAQKLAARKKINSFDNLLYVEKLQRTL
ncbi:MAG: PolC-type DNA polymerase III [Gallionellaceae bacterium]